MRNKTISNSLLLLSLLATIASYIIPNFNQFWMHIIYIVDGNYIIVFIQFILYQFIHAGFLHLLSNAIFIYIFGNQLEQLIWKNKYLLFFILNTLFVGISILIFSDWVTVWISWFALAILWYLMMVYKNLDKREFNWAVVLVIINIMAWLSENISFVWHFSWAIFGVLFYLIINKLKFAKL